MMKSKWNQRSNQTKKSETQKNKKKVQWQEESKTNLALGKKTSSFVWCEKCLLPLVLELFRLCGRLFVPWEEVVPSSLKISIWIP